MSALALAMVVGRVVHLVLSIAVNGATVAQELRGLFYEPWPGIAIQLAALPLLALLCRRARS